MHSDAKSNRDIHWLIYPYVVDQIAPRVLILLQGFLPWDDLYWAVLREEPVQTRGSWSGAVGNM